MTTHTLNQVVLRQHLAPSPERHHIAIAGAPSGAVTTSDVADALHALPNLVPGRLQVDPVWRHAVGACLGPMMTDGMQSALAAEMRI